MPWPLEVQWCYCGGWRKERKNHSLSSSSQGGREGGTEVTLTSKSMLLEQNISGFGVSYFVEVRQRFLCRQTKKEILKVALCDGEKKIGSDGRARLGQVWKGE